jgi:hypothetical protein
MRKGEEGVGFSRASLRCESEHEQTIPRTSSVVVSGLSCIHLLYSTSHSSNGGQQTFRRWPMNAMYLNVTPCLGLTVVRSEMISSNFTSHHKLDHTL